MIKANYIILPSRLNKMQPVDIPKDIILESSMNFNSDEFIEAVKDQMYELGVETSELAKMTYIGENRLRQLLLKRVKLTEDEIKEIRKRLHLSV